MSWRTSLASAAITSNCTESPSGLRATPSRTIMFNTPGRLESDSTRAGLRSGGLTERMWITPAGSRPGPVPDTGSLAPREHPDVRKRDTDNA